MQALHLLTSHTVKGFGIVIKADLDAFLELSCFFHDPADVGTQGDLTSLAPHERLPEIRVVPREKTPTGPAARGDPGDAPVLAS